MGEFFKKHNNEFNDFENNEKWRDLRILAKRGIREGDESDKEICWNYLGEDCYYGRGAGMNDYAAAYKIFIKNADLSGVYYLKAVKYIGVMYALGEGVKQDVDKAIPYLKAFRDWKVKRDEWSEHVTYYYGLLARKAYEKGDMEEVDRIMNIIKDAADKYSNSLCSFHYGTYLLQGVPFPYSLYDGTNANGKDPKKGYEYLLKSYNDGYMAAELAAFQIFLIHSHGCSKAISSQDHKLAAEALNFADARNFYPARVLKSQQYDVERSKRYTFKEVTTTYWSDGSTSSTSKYVQRSKYSIVDDSLNSLSNQIAMLRIHRHERYLLWIHDYAPIEVARGDGRLLRRYPKIEGAISRWPGYKLYQKEPARPIYEIDYDDVEIPDPYKDEPKEPTEKDMFKNMFLNGLKNIFFGRHRK